MNCGFCSFSPLLSPPCAHLLAAHCSLRSFARSDRRYCSAYDERTSCPTSMKFKMLVEDIKTDHGDIAGRSWHLKITLSDDEGEMALPVNNHLHLPNE